MGIQTEFNPVLALRNIREFETGKRNLEECIPNIKEGDIIPFLKKEQRNYYMKGEIPLVETGTRLF